MRKPDSITIGIIFVTILILGGIILAASRQGGASIPQYKISDAARPQAVISETSFDFGNMTLADKKIRDVQIKNIGTKYLILSDMITSCDCTFAQLIINGQASKLFSMRRDVNWRGEVAPGGEATLRIIYEPRIMPVQGRVKRNVVFKTNDPEKPLINVNFTADVR